MRSAPMRQTMRSVREGKPFRIDIAAKCAARSACRLDQNHRQQRNDEIFRLGYARSAEFQVVFRRRL
jgi:hypothetical protein